MTIVGFGIILLIICLVITGTSIIWLIARRRRGGGRTQKVSSSGVNMEMMSNNDEQEDDKFTPKKVLIYCVIIGFISDILSILIDALRLLSMASFVSASITIWYMFGEKFHKWQERKKSKSMFNRQ